MKPVIFIPGLPASELVRRRDGRCVFPPSQWKLMKRAARERYVETLVPDEEDDPLMAGEPIRSVFPIGKQAESLYDLLQGYGYDPKRPRMAFRAIGWDWRRNIGHPEVQGSIAAALDEIGGGVVAIVHSTGGLVLRRFLEDHPPRARSFDHIIAFGVPWAGTLESLHGIAIGERLGFLSKTRVRRIVRHSQAAWDLIPPDPSKTDLTGATLFFDELGEPATPLGDLTWLDESDESVRTLARRSHVRSGKRARTIRADHEPMPAVTNVAGWGAPTLTRCTRLGDGSLSFHSSADGDGTIPHASANWLRGVRTFHLPIGIYPKEGVPRRHNRIWDSPLVRGILDEVLTDQPLDVWAGAAVDGSEARRQSGDITVRMAASDGAGKPLRNASIRYRLGTRTKTHDLGEATRIEIAVPRELVRDRRNHDCRLEIELRWGTNESRAIPVLIPI